jgi:hypothetical protein
MKIYLLLFSSRSYFLQNLTKRSWIEYKKCAFCDPEKSVEHLFIKCKFAKIIWQLVYFTFNMPPPANIKNLFVNWLNGINQKTKSWIHMGVCAIP